LFKRELNRGRDTEGGRRKRHGGAACPGIKKEKEGKQARGV